MEQFRIHIFMKRLLFILLFSAVAISGFSQPIVTSTNQYTIYQLVKEKLFSEADYEGKMENVLKRLILDGYTKVIEE